MIKWAVVTSVVPFKVIFDGETSESPGVYNKIKGYMPKVNDRVCFLMFKNQYICLGVFE